MTSNARSGWVLTAVAIALLALGFVLGAATHDRLEATLTPGSFVADRMAECTKTIRIYELSEGDGELRDVVEPDLLQCARLVARFPDKIQERDREVADRITAASSSLQ